MNQRASQAVQRWHGHLHWSACHVMEEGPAGNVLATNTHLGGGIDIFCLVSEKQQEEWGCPL